MKNWNKSEIIENCLNHIEEDYLSFHDVFRNIYGFNKLKPNYTELKVTIELITFLVNERNVIPIFGPEMKPSGNSTKSDLNKIQDVIRNEDYENYDYGIWFDSIDNWK